MKTCFGALSLIGVAYACAPIGWIDCLVSGLALVAVVGSSIVCGGARVSNNS